MLSRSGLVKLDWDSCFDLKGRMDVFHGNFVDVMLGEKADPVELLRGKVELASRATLTLADYPPPPRHFIGCPAALYAELGETGPSYSRKRKRREPKPRRYRFDDIRQSLEYFFPKPTDCFGRNNTGTYRNGSDGDHSRLLATSWSGAFMRNASRSAVRHTVAYAKASAYSRRDDGSIGWIRCLQWRR